VILLEKLLLCVSIQAKMNVPLLDVNRQNSKLREAAIEKFAKIFDSGVFILGEDVEIFEKNVASYLGVKHAIGVSSGTDALLIALMALGIRDGDEVICQSFTFFATAGSIARVGAIPVFADIDRETYNISLDGIKKKVTKRTKAIIPVHLFGQSADIDDIVKFSDSIEVPVIEDCAQSFGAKRNGKQTGTFGEIGCFSFYPSKNLGGFGDAGLVCTDDDEIAEQLRILRVHGARSQYNHEIVGGNFRIDTIQAALLNLKLPHVDEYIESKRRNAKMYLSELRDIDGIVLPKEKDGNFHTWHQFTVRIKNGMRDKVLESLRKSGVGCNVYYPIPLDRQKCFEDYVSGDFTKVADEVSKDVISLPIFPELTTEEILYVCDTLKKSIESLK
jgi:dTDP-4-amino-4,6-dideoxygalactose transaminase